MKTVDMSLRILNWLAQQYGECGVVDISREFDIDKATVYRHLKTLVKAGFVERNPHSRRYRAGFALVELSGLVLSHIRLLDLARPLMAELWQTFGESMQLSILRGMRGLFNIHRIESVQGVKFASQLGTYSPIHCSSSGKSILAFLPQDSLARVLDAPLKQYTANTIIDPDVLLLELDLIREQGYATDNQGVLEHLSTVAAPIFAADHLPVAAIAVGAPSHLLDKKRINKILPELLIATRQLSQKLHNQPMPEAILP